METRREPHLEVHRSDVVVVTSTGEDAGDDAPRIVEAPRPRRTLAVVLGSVLALAAVLLLVLLFLDGGDDGVTARAPGQPAAGPAAPEGLGVQVDSPARVVAGTPATFVLRWRDGAGSFAGTMEDWGDGVGVGSVSLDRCPAATEAGAKPGSGQVPLRHTWSEPGTYAVVLSATTATCESGSPVTEDASATLTVEVVPAR